MPDAIHTADAGAEVVKTHSADMSMNEFVGWMSENLGILGVDEVLKQAAFLVCCDVLAQDMAKADLQLRERLPNNTSRIVMPKEHPIAAFLAVEPNLRHTWFEFKEMFGLWGAISQNSYAVVKRLRDGTPESIVPIQSGRVLDLVADGAIFYDVTAATLQEQALLGQSSMRVPERDMIHVRGRMLDGMAGYSTLRAGSKVLETGTSMDVYRDKLFSEEGQLRGVFRRDKEGTLENDAYLRLKSQLRAMMNRFRSEREPLVLEDGLDFKAISSDPSEIELSKQFEAQILQTCRLLRMPPHKVFHTSDTKYDNMDTQEKLYVGDTLVPYCMRYEQRYSKALLTREDRSRFFIWHDRDQMALKDTKLQTERIYRLVTTGIIEIDEARAEIGKNPLANKAGQVRLIPVNMIAIDRHNEVVLGTPAGSGQDQPKSDPTQDEPTEDGTDKPDEASPAKSLRLVSG